MSFLQQPNIQTLGPFFLRRAVKTKYQRETIDTLDGDFLDLDWARIDANNPSSKLAILLYGLEGDSTCTYTTNLIKKLALIGYDSVVMNYRGCSRPNKLPKSYHSGKSEDLDLVVSWILQNQAYSEITLIGYSVGGNIILKYLGEKSTTVDPRIKQAVAFSPPIDLEATAKKLAQPECWPYMKYWLMKFYHKLRIKRKMFPGLIDLRGFSKIKTFREYDRRYTAPLNGFSDEHDYWRQASSKALLTKIKVPTLLITSKDDPFLPLECIPYKEAELNSQLKLVVTETGGHVGFWTMKFSKGIVIDFLNEDYTLDFLLSR